MSSAVSTEVTTASVDSVTSDLSVAAQARLIDIRYISANPWQIRTFYDQISTINLAEDIRRNGLINPITVRVYPNKSGSYQVATGHTRLRAYWLLYGGYRVDGPLLEDEDGNKIPDLSREAQFANAPFAKGKNPPDYVEVRLKGAADERFLQIPCFIKELTDEQMMALCISENVHRRDVSALEEGLGFERMYNSLKIQNPKLTQEQVAARLGVSQPTFNNRLRLASKIPATTHRYFIGTGKGVLGQKVANELLALQNKYQIPQQVLEKIIEAISAGTVKLSDLTAYETALDFKLVEKDAFPELRVVRQWSGDPEKIDQAAAGCQTCPFYWRTPSKKFEVCAKPEHFDEMKKEFSRQKAEERKAEQAAVAQRRAELSEQGAGDVLRDATGKAMQQLPDRDENGVYIVTSSALQKLPYGGYETFRWQEIDREMAGCNSCQFYARVRGYNDNLTDQHVCLKPAHFKEMEKATDERRKQNQRLVNEATATAWNNQYGNNIVSQQTIDLESIRQLARAVVSMSMNVGWNSRPLVRDECQNWLNRHNLNSELVDTDFFGGDRVSLPLKWIDEELAKNPTMQVVSTAWAMLMDAFIRVDGVAHWSLRGKDTELGRYLGFAVLDETVENPKVEPSADEYTADEDEDEDETEEAFAERLKGYLAALRKFSEATPAPDTVAEFECVNCGKSSFRYQFAQGEWKCRSCTTHYDVEELYLHHQNIAENVAPEILYAPSSEPEQEPTAEPAATTTTTVSMSSQDDAEAESDAIAAQIQAQLNRQYIVSLQILGKEPRPARANVLYGDLYCFNCLKPTDWSSPAGSEKFICKECLTERSFEQLKDLYNMSLVDDEEPVLAGVR
jgi:ParB/RepB/Spo0J family partition protein